MLVGKSTGGSRLQASYVNHRKSMKAKATRKGLTVPRTPRLGVPKKPVTGPVVREEKEQEDKGSMTKHGSPLRQKPLFGNGNLIGSIPEDPGSNNVPARADFDQARATLACDCGAVGHWVLKGTSGKMRAAQCKKCNARTSGMKLKEKVDDENERIATSEQKGIPAGREAGFKDASEAEEDVTSLADLKAIVAAQAEQIAKLEDMVKELRENMTWPALPTAKIGNAETRHTEPEGKKSFSEVVRNARPNVEEAKKIVGESQREKRLEGQTWRKEQGRKIVPLYATSVRIPSGKMRRALDAAFGRQGAILAVSQFGKNFVEILCHQRDVKGVEMACQSLEMAVKPGFQPYDSATTLVATVLRWKREARQEGVRPKSKNWYETMALKHAQCAPETTQTSPSNSEETDSGGSQEC